MQECRQYYAGASFETSPPASQVPLPPAHWIKNIKLEKKKIGNEEVKTPLPAKTLTIVVRKGKFLTSN